MKKIYTNLRNLGLATMALTSMIGSSMAQCPTEVAPYTQDFSSGAIPLCWVNLSSDPSTSANNFWKFSGAPGYGATANGRTTGTYAWSDGSTPNPQSMSLTTPLIDLAALTVPALALEWFSNNTNNPGDNNPMTIEVNDGTTWTTIATLQGDDPLWQEEILDLSAFTGLTVSVRFSVDQSLAGTAFYNDVLLDEVQFLEAPSCFKPMGLSASNITATNADLAWIDNNGATEWDLEWGLNGFSLGSGNSLNPTTSNPLSVTIAPNTDYEFYVRAICAPGDTSTWAGPYWFSNDYCAYTISSTSPQHINSFITTGAIVDINNPNSGPGTTTPGYSDFSTTVLEAYETQIIDFDIVTSNTSTYGVAIYIDINNDFVFDPSERVFYSGGYVSQPSSGSVTIPVGTPMGNYRMRVIADYLGNNPGPCSGSSAEAEDYTVTIIAPPTCLPVMDIDTVNVSTTSIELSWTELNSASSWEIEYGPAGFTQGTGMFATANTNIGFTILGLNPSAQYDFYIQADCGGGDLAAWRGPFSMYTDCGIAVAPFYDGFNNAIQPQCWENLSSNTSTSVNNFWNFDDQGDYAAANNGRNAGEFVKVDGNSPYGDSVMLITPQIDISQLATPYLSFEWFSNNTNNPGDNVPLIIEVYDGTSWNFLDTLRGDSPDWEFVNYDLSAYVNNIIKVRFMVNKSVTTSYSYYNDILLDEVRIDDCISLGGVDGSFDICRLDSNVNLNDNIIVKPNGGGKWSFPSQPTFISQDSIFGVTYLPAGSYDVFYVERYVCYDTTTATINVFGPSSAGSDGTIDVCKNEPVNLYGVLGGNIDIGGVWYDFTNTALPNSQPKAESIPGQYNYTYVVTNGVCPADTSIVEIGVLDSCDFLALGEELFTDISVYPNPATSQLNIVNPSNTAALRVEMFDMNGRTVLIENKALNNASQATLAIDHLEKGIYTLRIYNNEGQKTFKVVKQ
jgi:hypothetical protein